MSIDRFRIIAVATILVLIQTVTVESKHCSWSIFRYRSGYLCIAVIASSMTFSCFWQKFWRQRTCSCSFSPVPTLAFIIFCASQACCFVITRCWEINTRTTSYFCVILCFEMIVTNIQSDSVRFCYEISKAIVLFQRCIGFNVCLLSCIRDMNDDIN